MNKINNQTMKIIALFALMILSISFASALVINNVNVGVLHPGEETSLSIQLKNNLNDDVEDVSLSLNFANLPLSAVSGSEDSVSEIQSDDKEELAYRIKASSDATAGDYSVPYTLTYDDGSAVLKTSSGTISVTISASPILEYSIESDNPVQGQKAKLTLRIINKGLGDAKFVSLSVSPKGMTLLSAEDVYIGTIASDDSETVSFDSILTSVNPALSVLVQYKDTENNPLVSNAILPITVYSQEQALKLGITKKSRAPVYISVIVILFVIWMVRRFLKKRARAKKNEAR